MVVVASEVVPVIIASPTTESFREGDVVPIPKLPEFEMRARSTDVTVPSPVV